MADLVKSTLGPKGMVGGGGCACDHTIEQQVRPHRWWKHQRQLQQQEHSVQHAIL